MYTGFSQSALASCRIGKDGRIEGLVAPEIQPINPSPWYGFRVEGPPRATPEITLRYAVSGHRYHPWVQSRQGSWRRLPDDAVALAADGSATFRLPPLDGSLQVAAQPLDDPAAALARFEAHARAGRLTRIEAGRSLDGAPILAFLHRPATARGLLLFITRQHPPEWPGAMAFDRFAQALLSDDPAMVALRKDHAILFVPVMNPDGIARGHWRGNRRGADLNRDWGTFIQPETWGVGALLEPLTGKLPLLAAIDFHSTRNSILYAPPDDPKRQDIGFRITRDLASEPDLAGLPIRRSHQNDAGTLKGWTLDRFGISGLTFEIGDDTPLSEAHAKADAFARLLARSVASPKDQP